MFTVNFSSPLSNSDFDMNHDGGIYERYAATVTSFFLVGANTAPVITSDGGGASASVDVDENQTAVTTVTATDTEDDGGSPPTSLRFSISGGADSGAFDIGGASGILTFRSAPDFENPTDTGADNIYDVEVTVTDSGDLTATQAIAVTVTDVSEDTTSPAVQILGAPATLADLTPFTVTIQFSEDVTGFSSDGITVGNGAASGFVAVDAHRYTVAITPTGVGDLTIGVGAGIAVDGANNPNTAATQVVVGNTIVANTRRVVVDFMSERASLITRSQPGLVNRLDRRSGATEAPFTYSANGDLSNFVAGFSTTLQHSGGLALAEIIKAAPDLSSAESGYAPFELWIDGKWAHADRGLTDTDFGALHFGIDYLINPNLVVGVMGQIDWTSQHDATAGSYAGGLGYMAGPYMAARLHENLYFEGSLQVGEAANQVDPLGLYVDTFETDRWLANAKLSGQFEVGDFTFSPILSGSYYGETQLAYVDGLGNDIAAQTIGMGSLDFGPKVSYLIDAEAIDVQLALGLIGSWDYRVNGSGDATTDLSARVEGSLDLRLDGGARVNASVFYDGVGRTDRSSYGFGASLRVPSN